MPMDIDRVQDAKGKGKVRVTIRMVKVRMRRAKERQEKETRKETKVIRRAKVRNRPER